jgi:VCBS repeat-containing protein
MKVLSNRLFPWIMPILLVGAASALTITPHSPEADYEITVTAFGAVDDDYTGSNPITENQVLVIPEGGTDLNANDDPANATITAVNGVDGSTGTSTNGAAITLTNRGNFTYDPTAAAAIQALDHGETLTDTFTYTITDSPTFPTGRFVRVMNNGAVNRRLDMGEIEVFAPGVTLTSDNAGGNAATDYATPGAGASIEAKGATNSFSCQHDCNDDANLIDGAETSAGNTFAISGVGAYVIVDLGVDREIEIARIHQRVDCCWERLQDFTVSIIADDGFGSPGAVVQSKSYPGQPANNLYGELFFDPSPGATTDVATVKLHVTGVNDAPVAANDSAALTESRDAITNPTATGNVLTNDTDVDDPNGNFSVTQVNGAAGNVGNAITTTYGNITINADGSYTYTLDDADPDTQALTALVRGIESITYTMSDGHDNGTGNNNPLSDSAILVVTITGSNDTPVATANTARVRETTSTTDSGNLQTDDDGFGLDSDVDDPDDLRIITDVDGTSVSTNTGVAGSYGTLNVSSDGAYTYSLDGANPAILALLSGQTVTDTFTYTLNDAVVPGTTRGRFLQIQNNGTTSRALHIGEIEAFTSGVAALALTSLDGTNDLARSSKGASVYSATVGGGHGVATATIDGVEQSDGATWTVTALNAQITIDLGGTFDIDRVRAHQRNDSCCQDRLKDFTVRLYEDDGTGSPGSIVASGYFPGQPATNSSGEVTLAPVNPLEGRFIHIQNLDESNRGLHIGEIEAFSSTIPGLALTSLDGVHDLALSSKGAGVYSASVGGGHGVSTATIDGAEQTAGSTWTVTAVGAHIIIDLGDTLDVERVRAHQRNDGCCQDRLRNFIVMLHADDGTGNPGAVVASGIHSGQPATNSSGEVTLEAVTPLEGRFVQVQNNGGANRALHIGEIEAFPPSAPPLAVASRDGTNDLALSSKTATVESATVGGGHGAATATIDGAEQTGGATWTVTAVDAQITIDLGTTFEVNRVRVHQRNDGCCQSRLNNFTVRLLADDGTGNPGEVIASTVYPGQPANNSSGQILFAFASLDLSRSGTATLTVTIDGDNPPRTVFRFR